MSELNEAVKTGATYAKDVAERVVWTFVTAAGAVAFAAGPADLFSASLRQTAAAAGFAAVGSLAKGLLASAVGEKNSASTARGV